MAGRRLNLSFCGLGVHSRLEAKPAQPPNTTCAVVHTLQQWRWSCKLGRITRDIIFMHPQVQTAKRSSEVWNILWMCRQLWLFCHISQSPNFWWKLCMPRYYLPVWLKSTIWLLQSAQLNIFATKILQDFWSTQFAKHRPRRNVTSLHSLSHLPLLYFNFFKIHH